MLTIPHIIVSKKPQTYFNEAKLTAIALSIRFALLDTTMASNGRFLALDDMLISLDMSNRMKVVNYLLDASPSEKFCLPDRANAPARRRTSSCLLEQILRRVGENSPSGRRKFSVGWEKIYPRVGVMYYERSPTLTSKLIGRLFVGKP